MYEIREDRKYTRTHQWVQEENGRVLVGITDYAQRELRAIVFVDLPETGDPVKAGEPFGEVESMKVVAEVISPVSGTVCRVNEEVMDDPSLINDGPYDAWLIEAEDVTERMELLSPAEYRRKLEMPGG